MEINAFLALLPLIIFLIISIIWHGKGLLHLLLVAYSIILAIIAVTNDYGMLFFPVCVGGFIIGIILFLHSMLKGDWL